MLFRSSSSSSSISSSSLSSSSSSSSSTFGFLPNIVPFIIPPISSSFDFNTGFRPFKRFRGKQKTKYTPSYEAIIFNIRGKAPKGVETGARIRPILGGFNLKRFGKIGLKGGKKRKW